MVSLSERKSDGKLCLFAQVVDKAEEQQICDSIVTEMNAVVPSSVIMTQLIATEGASSSHQSQVQEVGHAQPSASASCLSLQADVVDKPHGRGEIDWDNLQLEPIPEEDAAPVIGDDEMFALLGLEADDERAERQANETHVAVDDPPPVPDGVDLEGVVIPVNDVIPGEAVMHFDRENPPMTVGSTYPSMDDFRMMVRQHAIKGEFELGREKSEPDRFRGFCKADECKWKIVARLVKDDGQSVRVTVNNNQHCCSSTGRVMTKMASTIYVLTVLLSLLWQIFSALIIAAKMKFHCYFVPIPLQASTLTFCCLVQGSINFLLHQMNKDTQQNKQGIHTKPKRLQLLPIRASETEYCHPCFSVPPLVSSAHRLLASW